MSSSSVIQGADFSVFFSRDRDYFGYDLILGKSSTLAGKNLGIQ